MQHNAQCMLITAYDDSCILNNCCPTLSVIWSKIKNYIQKHFTTPTQNKLLTGIDDY